MLRIRLIGQISVERDGEALTPPASRRAWELLAWLALHPGAHPRGELAARFWPDVLDESARQSLRNALWMLRRDLGDAAGGLHAGGEPRAPRGGGGGGGRGRDPGGGPGDAAGGAG